MAISWGAYNGHLRVGIDHSISPSSPSHSDTTVSVTWTWYIGTDGWNFSGDASTMREDCDGWGGTNDAYTNNLTSGHMKVGSHTETYGISYNSGSKTASGSSSGSYNGAHPSHSVTINLPDRPVAAPSAGEAATASAIGTTDVTISWDPPNDNGGANVDEYQLEVSTSSSFSSTVYNNTATYSGRSQHVTGLDPNTHYYARVRAHNSAGWGDWTSSTYCQFTTLSGTPSTPGRPNETQRTQTSQTWGWSASSNNGGTGLSYTVELYSDAGLTTLVASASGLTGTSHQFTGLTAGTTYYCRVQASNSNGTSGWSGTGSAATLSTTTYTDSGDYTTLVNNLASAVADKIMRLGCFLFRGDTGSPTVASGATLWWRMNTAIETDARADAPSWNNTADSANVTINYPGTYLIEYYVHVPGTNAADLGNGYNVTAYVNGHAFPDVADPRGGAENNYWAGSNASGSFLGVTFARRLQVGDTLGWALENNTNVSKTISGSDGSLETWCRVTMIGF